MKNPIILFLLIFFCFQSQAQNLSIDDMQSIYKLPNWEAVDTYLNSKGWSFEGSEKKTDGNSTIAWTYKKSSTEEKANGWFYLTLDGAKFSKLRYELSDVAKYNLEKSSITKYGYKLHDSEIYNDALVTEYRNTSFQVLFIITKESDSYTDVTIRSIFMERLQPSLPIPQPTTINATSTPLYGTVKDIDGNIYKTVKIGNQEWMAENLNVTKYNDGTPIPVVTDSMLWISTKSPAMCWFNNDKTKYTLNKSGALYNSFTIEKTNLCPVGWHIPDGFEVLDIRKGGANNYALKDLDANNFKASYTWDTNNGNNIYGFSALPTGFRGPFQGGFDGYNNNCYWWNIYHTPLKQGTFIGAFGIKSSEFISGNYNPNYGFSVRCIKN